MITVSDLKKAALQLSPAERRELFLWLRDELEKEPRIAPVPTPEPAAPEATPALDVLTLREKLQQQLDKITGEPSTRPKKAH